MDAGEHAAQLQGNLYLSPRLYGQDERLDQLSDLFEQLQLATVETSDPALDLLTFSERAFYFAVIMKGFKSTTKTQDNENPKKRKSWPASLPQYEAPMFKITPDNEKPSAIVDLPRQKFLRLESSRLVVSHYPSTSNRIDATSSFHSFGGPDASSSQSQYFRNIENSTNRPSHRDPIPTPSDQPAEFEREPEPALTDLSTQQQSLEAIGLVYLTASDRDCLRDRELNIGIIIDPRHRGKGHGRLVIDSILDLAFEKVGCHRVQAILPDHVAKNRAICFFTQMRFDHEGTRRRGFYSAMEGMYKDVTYMGIVDTDWVLRKSKEGVGRVRHPASQSLWDELLLRHQREREELLAWEDNMVQYGSRAQTPTQRSFEYYQSTTTEGDDEVKTKKESLDGIEAQEMDTVSALSIDETSLVATQKVSESDSMSERSGSPGGYSSSSGSEWDIVYPPDSDSDDSSSSLSSLSFDPENIVEVSSAMSNDDSDSVYPPNYLNPPRPERSLSGRVAIVTGAGSQSSGIGNGRAAAILLAEAGARVICADINLDWATTTATMIESEFGPNIALPIQADVTKAADCERTVDLALQHFGRLDILVNNVGVRGPTGTAVEVKPDEWARGLEINVTSMMLMAKYAVPAMERNRKGTISGRGSIVNIASVAGMIGGTPMLLYPTSKGAIVNMTRAMAAHHAPAGIRVNCVCPGMLFTPMLYSRGMTDEVRDARRKRSLLQTEGNGWDAGAAVRFLASDEARWITGVILPVDAGTTAAIPQSGDLAKANIFSTLNVPSKL
ncbi:hypothetical protein H0H93_004138 [Arthromyces matolae]|nr:hypothetical protein H0H93_004138 [Arthromyces matolae]